MPRQPLWKIGTRAQAMEILVESRDRIIALVNELDDSQMKPPTKLGGGQWSVKDLLGHLAGVEEQAVALAKGEKPGFHFASNEADIERKKSWSIKRIRQDRDKQRADLLDAIDTMDDSRWVEKIQTRTGRSALALVLGKLLVGGHYGLFAHDLAHIQDLKRSVKELKGSAK